MQTLSPDALGRVASMLPGPDLPALGMAFRDAAPVAARDLDERRAALDAAMAPVPRAVEKAVDALLFGGDPPPPFADMAPWTMREFREASAFETTAASSRTAYATFRVPDPLGAAADTATIGVRLYCRKDPGARDYRYGGGIIMDAMVHWGDVAVCAAHLYLDRDLRPSVYTNPRVLGAPDPETRRAAEALGRAAADALARAAWPSHDRILRACEAARHVLD